MPVCNPYVSTAKSEERLGQIHTLLSQSIQPKVKRKADYKIKDPARKVCRGDEPYNKKSRLAAVCRMGRTNR